MVVVGEGVVVVGVVVVVVGVLVVVGELSVLHVPCRLSTVGSTSA